MLNDRYVFSQLIDSLPKYEFDRCVARYHGNRRIRHFSCFDQFLCMAFAQLTYRESLRDIEICLRALHKKFTTRAFAASSLGARSPMPTNTATRSRQRTSAKSFTRPHSVPADPVRRAE